MHGGCVRVVGVLIVVVLWCVWVYECEGVLCVRVVRV